MKGRFSRPLRAIPIIKPKVQPQAGSFDVIVKGESVVMQFKQPINQFSLSTSQARSFAEILNKLADQIEEKEVDAA